MCNGQLVEYMQFDTRWRPRESERFDGCSLLRDLNHACVDLVGQEQEEAGFQTREGGQKRLRTLLPLCAPGSLSPSPLSCSRLEVRR